MKLNISYHLEENRLTLPIEITNDTDKDQTFYFYNGTGALARNGIRLFNTRDEQIEPYERTFISPIYTGDKVRADLLAPNETGQFELQGKIIEEDGELLLSFKGISFRIVRNEIFYLMFNFLGGTSNLLEVVV
ncbi:hypothetical protein EG346_14850 [Chryseobacterium carnipullorum]|uniref:Uncharacterized protein n=1 Tax=Chryseobacterium carnipullorum TaxID=1124835 RepID=A0A376DRN1_CHRCU|nr:hypothetical protein [Chryseobacterium carnipullorum]AZA49376.1 hypothetical protein EG346_14850 [Chryseobacterium carnipullorum]AZA64264.1 hypothetical protein EG345_05785 [Chryseobacterium carnipullorum]STC94235.1 Uncharacterised protein [Chryseobacterium carnipullorum]